MIGEKITYRRSFNGKSWEVIADPFKRYQKQLCIGDLFPDRVDKTCACGCGVQLTGRKRRWATKECEKKSFQYFSIKQGNITTIRMALYNIDRGACRMCGEITDNWHADHIIPVHKGGGFCEIGNFQTLCIDCHKEKTKIDMQ